MPSCINCLNLKFKKGWLKAYCSKGNILYAVKEGERDFQWKVENGHNLLKRSHKMKALNPEICVDYEAEDLDEPRM